MTDDRIIKTHVWHGDQCFFVSTIERDSSAAECQSRYNETMVWTYDWDKRERGEIIWQDETCRGSICLHQKIVQQLFETGKPEAEETE